MLDIGIYYFVIIVWCGAGEMSKGPGATLHNSCCSSIETRNKLDAQDHQAVIWEPSYTADIL